MAYKKNESTGGEGSKRGNSQAGQYDNAGAGASGAAAGGRRVFFRRRKSCPLATLEAEYITYKNIRLLSRFTSERGRILPSRITSVSAKKQRMVNKAIKQARDLALLPYASQ